MTAIGAYFRLVRAGWIMAREGVVAALPGDQLSGPPRAAWRLARLFARRRSSARGRTERIGRAVERLGPSYVKLGQFLATRPDVVGHDLAIDLARLQDRMETFPRAEAVAAIEGSLGRPLDDLFLDFGDPVAAASIAQVHPAHVERGGRRTRVAVKVIRPGVRRRFQQDLESFFLAARMQERFLPAARRLKPVEVARTLAQTTKIEMDLRLEAAALSELGENTKEDPGFRVPWVDWERTGRDVVTLEWIDGVKMSNVAALREAGHDLEKLAATLVQSFLRHTLRDGFFHADMHPGNILVRPGSEQYIALDFGIMGTLTEVDKQYLARNFLAFFRRDYKGVALAHLESGWVPPDTRIDELEAAVRAVCEPVFDRPLKEISFGRVLLQLFQASRRFNVEIQPQLVLLQKTLLNIEGLGRQLDPELDLWKTAKPFLERWMNEQVGWRALVKNLQTEAPKWAALLPQLPRLAHQALNENRLTQLEAGLALMLRQQHVRNRWLGVIAGLLAALSAVLLYSVLH